VTGNSVQGKKGGKRSMKRTGALLIVGLGLCSCRNAAENTAPSERIPVSAKVQSADRTLLDATARE